MLAFTKRIATATYAQFATVVLQLVVAPIFLSHWGAAKYGEWLLLVTLLALLTSSDLGVSTVAANRVLALDDSDNESLRLELFSNAVALSAALSLLLVSCTVVSLYVWESIPIATYYEVVALIVLALSQQMAILYFHFSRTSARNELHIQIFTTSRILEGIATIVVMICGGGFFELILAMTLNNCCTVWVQASTRARESGPLKWQTTTLNLPLMFSLLRLGIPAAAFPVGLNASLTLPTHIVGIVGGPASVAMFVTSRTLARLVFQVANVSNLAFAREIGMLRGQKDLHFVRRRIVRLVIATSCVAVIVALGLAFAGEYIYSMWLARTLALDRGTFDALLVGALFGTIWLSATLPLSVNNEHYRFSYTYLALTMLASGFAWVLADSGHIKGAYGIAIVCAVSEILMCAWAIHLLRRNLERRPHGS